MVGSTIAGSHGRADAAARRSRRRAAPRGSWKGGGTVKAIGNYVRECCGKRLPGRYNFCPICGAEAKRPAASEAVLILIEIDQRARGCESQAAKMQEKIQRLDSGRCTEAELCGAAPACCRREWAKSVAGFAKAALWYRSVEALITRLSERK